MKNWHICKNDLKYALTIFRHPIDEFWEMKRAAKGNIAVVILLMALYFMAVIFNRQTLSFMYNTQYNIPLDIAFQLRIFIFPLAIFCIANWSVTTLMDGKGTFLDIFMVVGYSLQILILFNLITPILSHMLSLNEAAYLSMINIGGMTWFCMMVFIGIQQVHEYSIGKTVITFLLTVFAAAIILFICMLFFSLIQEITGFFYSIYRELSLRIYG